jgi:hypothetical protein
MTRDELMKLLDDAIDALDSEADCPDRDSGPALRAVRDALRSVREHLIETDEQRRERFEAWCTSTWLSDAGETQWFGRRNDVRYWIQWVEDQWTSWQAALTWRGETKGGE